MKQILFIVFLFFMSSDVFAWCIAGRGNTCNRSKKQERSSGQINNNYFGIGGSEGTRNPDGGHLRKQDAGDKSKNQGYAAYKQHFIYYGYAAYVVPHQDGYHKSSDTTNREIAYEYAFSPYVSVKAQKSEFTLDGLTNGSSMKQEHLIALLNIRLYLLKDFVIRAGMGIGQSKIEAASDIDRFNYSEAGSTEIVQFSGNYIFGDENTFVGMSTTTIQGASGDVNLGSSSYSINVGIGL